MNLASFSDEVHRSFDRKAAARDRALIAARRAIRSSANAIRAVHRGELDAAHRLMDDAKAALDEGKSAVSEDHPDVYHAGFLQDAQKEYAEARLTEGLVTGAELPGADELGMELPAFLNGMAETIGEGRRAVLDLLRSGEVERAERILETMEDFFHVLVTVDYPDAMTRNLRRSTDAARSILEKTRGDLSLSIVQRRLQDALERHAERLGEAQPEGSAGS